MLSKNLSNTSFESYGFNDWSHPERIQTHENSKGHRDSLLIYLTRKNASMKMITTTGCFNPKTNFILYVRLATVMGLTWVTGLVAGFIDVTWLWYTFVVFNTLQGTVDSNIV